MTCMSLRRAAPLLALVAMFRRFRPGSPVPLERSARAKLRFLPGLLVSLALFSGLGTHALAHDDDDDCDRPRDLVLVNGKIVTMDGRNSVASSVTMRNGRIVAVGHRDGQ